MSLEMKDQNQSQIDKCMHALNLPHMNKYISAIKVKMPTRGKTIDVS